MGSAYMFVTTVSMGSCIGVIADKECDMGLIAYEMTLLVDGFSDLLSARTDRRAENLVAWSRPSFVGCTKTLIRTASRETGARGRRVARDGRGRADDVPAIHGNQQNRPTPTSPSRPW